MFRTASNHIVVGPATDSSHRHNPSFPQADDVRKDAVALSYANQGHSGASALEGEVVPMGGGHASLFRPAAHREGEAGAPFAFLPPTWISTSSVPGDGSASSSASSPEDPSSLASPLPDRDAPSSALGAFAAFHSSTTSHSPMDHTHPSRQEERGRATVASDGRTAAPHSTKSLSLIHQNITALRHLKDLPTLRSLLALRLHMNHIRLIEPGIFKPLTALEELDMSANDLTCVEDTAFLGLGRLRRLDLSGNAIQTLSRQCLAPLGSLQWMTVAFNELRDIDAMLSLPPSSHLWYLNIAGNRIPHLSHVERALREQKPYLTTLCLRVLLPPKGEAMGEDLPEGIKDGQGGPSTPPFLCRENPFVVSPTGASPSTVPSATSSSWYDRRLVDTFPSLVVLDGVTVAVDPLRAALQTPQKRHLNGVGYAQAEGSGNASEGETCDTLPRRESTGNEVYRTEEAVARPTPPFPLFSDSLPSLPGPSPPLRAMSMPQRRTATAWPAVPARQRVWSLPRKPHPIPRAAPSGLVEKGGGGGRPHNEKTKPFENGWEAHGRHHASPSARRKKTSDPVLRETPPQTSAKKKGETKKKSPASPSASSVRTTSRSAGAREDGKHPHSNAVSRDPKKHPRRSHASEAHLDQKTHPTPPFASHDVHRDGRHHRHTPSRPYGSSSSTRTTKTRLESTASTPSPSLSHSSSWSSSSTTSTTPPPPFSAPPLASLPTHGNAAERAGDGAVLPMGILSVDPSANPAEETRVDPKDKVAAQACRTNGEEDTARVWMRAMEEEKAAQGRAMAALQATVAEWQAHCQASQQTMAQQQLSHEAAIATAACREKDLLAQTHALRSELSRKAQEAVLVRKHLTAAFQGEQRQAAVGYQRRVDTIQSALYEQCQRQLQAVQDGWAAQQEKAREAAAVAMQERETQWEALHRRAAAAAAAQEGVWHSRWAHRQQRVALAVAESDARHALLWEWGASLLLAPSAGPVRRRPPIDEEEEKEKGRAVPHSRDVRPVPTDVRDWMQQCYRLVARETQKQQMTAQQTLTQQVAFLEAQWRRERKRWAEEKRDVYAVVEAERMTHAASLQAVHAEMEEKLHSFQQRLAAPEAKERSLSIACNVVDTVGSPSSQDSGPSSSPRWSARASAPPHSHEVGEPGGASLSRRVATTEDISSAAASMAAAVTLARESDGEETRGGRTTSPLPLSFAETATPDASAALAQEAPRAPLPDGSVSALPTSRGPWEQTLQQWCTVCEVMIDTQRGLYKENDRLLRQVKEWEHRFQQDRKETNARIEDERKAQETRMVAMKKELEDVSVDRDALQREVRNLRVDLGQKGTLIQELEEEAMHKLDEKRQRIATLEEELDQLREQVGKGTSLSAEYRDRLDAQEQQLQRLQSGLESVFFFSSSSSSSSMGNGNRQSGSHTARWPTGIEVMTPIRHRSGSPSTSARFGKRHGSEDGEEDFPSEGTTTTTHLAANQVLTGSRKPIHTERMILQVEELVAQLKVSQKQIEHYQTQQQDFVAALRRARNDLSVLVHKVDTLEMEKAEERRRVEMKDVEIHRLRERIISVDQQSKEKQVATLEAVTQMMKAGL